MSPAILILTLVMFIWNTVAVLTWAYRGTPAKVAIGANMVFILAWILALVVSQ